MTVIAAQETYENRKASLDESFKTDDVRTYRVLTDNKNDTGIDVIVGAILLGYIPNVFSPHQSYFRSLVRNIDATQEAGAKVWKVTCNYSSVGKDPAKADEDPLQKPTIRTYAVQKLKRHTWLDKDNLPILNTANTLFAPLEVEYAAVTLKFQRNEAFFDGSIPIQYVECLNSSSFGGADPGTVRCEDISAEEKYENDYHYWAVHYSFAYNRYGWQPRVLQQGLQERFLVIPTTTTYKIRRIKDGRGEDIKEPVPLDSNGFKIDPTNLPGAAIYRTYNVFNTADFSALNLL